MPVRTLLLFAAPYRFRLLLVGVLTAGSALVTLAVPWLAARMLGGILAPDALGLGLGELVGLLFVALTSVALLNFAVAYASGATASRLLADLRVKVYQHLQALPVGFHENSRQGDILALMTYEVERLSHFLTGTLANIPSQLLLVSGAVVIMFRIDARLALLAPLLVPAFYLVLKIMGRRLRGLAQAIQQAEAEVVAVAEENLEMLPVIKAFTREDVETRRYAGVVGRAMDLALQESRINAALGPAIGLVAAIAAVLLLLLAGRTVEAGSMSPTNLFSFLFYAALLTRPVAELAQVYGQIQMARGTLARLERVFAQAREPGYAAIGKMPVAMGEIVFSKVGFAYPGRETILREVNLHIRPGETVAMTGHNGAGKSTLVRLLLRYDEPVHGSISIDGHDIDQLDVRELRRQIGLVPQRVMLLNGSVRENIVYGNEGASDGEVEEAARLAQAWDFITELPRGFETLIGDHGVLLSGGQRQRIALARALVKNPPVLVLDEATSMYDLEGESAFIAACETALGGRTVIMITHRPLSLALADRVVSIEEGKVIECTTDTLPRASNGA